MLDSPSNKLALSFPPFFRFFFRSQPHTFCLTHFSTSALSFPLISSSFFHIFSFLLLLKTAYLPPSSLSGPLRLHRSHTSGFHASYFCLLNLIGQRWGGGRWMGVQTQKLQEAASGRIHHFPSFFSLRLFDSFILQGQLLPAMVLQRE